MKRILTLLLAALMLLPLSATVRKKKEIVKSDREVTTNLLEVNE